MTGSALAGRRTATIDAFIDLVIETGGSPRPESVARRAGISIASLYRYFDNLDELRRDAFDRVLDRFPDLFLPGSWPYFERDVCLFNVALDHHHHYLLHHHLLHYSSTITTSCSTTSHLTSTSPLPPPPPPPPPRVPLFSRVPVLGQ